MRAVLQDLRYAARLLCNSPGFTTVAVITLALGIGANTAIFSVVNAVLLKPFPYHDPSRLVLIGESLPHLPRMSVSLPDYFDWRAQQRAFESMAVGLNDRAILTSPGEPAVPPTMETSAGFWSTLGAKPILGRVYTPEEDRPGGPAVAVVSYGFWRSRFGGESSALGRTVVLDRRANTVIGVMPAGFDFFPGYPTEATQIWRPLGDDNAAPEYLRRGTHEGFEVVARLKPGVTLESARAEMQVIAQRLAAKYPATNRNTGVFVDGYKDAIVGDTRPALLALLGAVALVLLIACANMAGLMLARAATRQRSLAIRAALGASRLDLLRESISESLLLALAGGAIGVLLANWGISLAVSLIPPEIPRATMVTIDLPVLAFALGASLITGILFGLFPAWQGGRAALSDSLKQATRTASAGLESRRFRQVLVCGEVALAFVLLNGAGLLLRSFLRLTSIDPGFNPQHVLTMETFLPAAKYPTPERQQAFFDQAFANIAAIPGVKTVGLMQPMPLTLNSWIESVHAVDGHKLGEDSHPVIDFSLASLGALRALDVHLVRGRLFTDQDNGRAPNVAIIDDALARQYWPDGDAVGHTLDTRGTRLEIVGVIHHLYYRQLSDRGHFECLVPVLQNWIGGGRILVRTSDSISDPLSLASAVKRAFAQVDSTQPLISVASMDRLLNATLAPRRLSLWLIATFAGLAILLAALGVYGVLAYSVSRRTHEIGTRIALGADRPVLLRMVLAQGLVLIGTGAGIGLLTSLGSGRVLGAFLFGVRSGDVATLAAITFVVAGAGLLASYLPARRAARVDPMVALRYE